jgi:hypothetical protein
MSQNRIEIAVRHTASDNRKVIKRVINTKDIDGVPTEVVNYNGREHRVVRRGRGIFIWSNRPLGVASQLEAAAA